jgi:CRP-like cAMP-binding protein
MRIFQTKSLIAFGDIQPRFQRIQSMEPANAACALARQGMRVLTVARETTANKILAALSASDFALLAPHLSPVDLPVRRQLEIRNRKIEHVYFLESGIGSVVISAGSNHSIEVGIIGNEGMTGLPVILASDRALHETFMQGAGHGWRIGVEEFRAAMHASASLRTVMLHYALTMVSQMAFTALANGRYKIEERLARWLLMAADRTQDNVITLTHEFLSVMLGARRPGITNALNAFEKRGIITARRGMIEIVNRHALEEAANGSYGGPEAEYQRLFSHV